MELLLCCARTQLGPELTSRIRSIAQREIGWACLLEMARANGVTPLLYRSLTAACPDAVPEAILGDLAERYRANAICGLLMTAELLRLLELFAAHGIEAIPFKGPALAASAYGDVALREFSDLDILMRKRDFRRAGRLLASHGYRSFRWNFEQQGSGLVVELHRWEGRERQGLLGTGSLLGVTVPALGPEDALLGLCTHGSKHCWDRLTWVCDLAQFMAAEPGICWARVLEQARRTGGRRGLLCGLLLVRDLLGVPLPREVPALAAEDSRLAPLVAEARRRILHPQPAPFGNIERWATRLRMMERLRDRMCFCLRLLHEGLRPNRTDRAAVPLPGCLHVLYYVIHPVRVLATYGPRGVRHLLTRRGASTRGRAV